MSTVKIDKTIIVKDEYGVTRQAFVAGDVVEQYIYNAVLSSSTVQNPKDLPVQPDNETVTSLNQGGIVETKELPAPEVAEKEPVVEEAEDAPTDEAPAPKTKGKK